MAQQQVLAVCGLSLPAAGEGVAIVQCMDQFACAKFAFALDSRVKRADDALNANIDVLGQILFQLIWIKGPRVNHK
ncbi:hypothetical protein [Pseudomonas sp. S1_G07]